jgi:hypothetical protein
MLSVKKRGKSNVKVTVSDAVSIHNKTVLSPDQLPSNLILHLKRKIINEKDDLYTEKDILEYNPKITTPSAYDPIDVSKFSYVETKHKEKNDDSSENKQPIKNLCWWCCHEFSNKSIGLPISKKNEGIYECVGSFCSPECTCAYIMDSGSRYGERWKEYELLHEMINVNEKINPAPRRELLTVFGGNLGINEFRGNTNWKIVYPPMVSLKMQMDDTPTEKDEQSPLFLSSTSLKVGNLNLDNIDDIIPEKRKKKGKAINTNGSLDRFWGIEE